MIEQFVIQNSQCIVTIREITYDNLQAGIYKQILNPERYDSSDFAKVFSIQIRNGNHDIMLAIIGSYMSELNHCALLENQVLTLMMNEQFFRIDALNGSVIDYKVFDILGSNFAIFKTHRGYVVHGEVEILFLNENLEKAASFSGRDIFVSISGKQAFTLTKDNIQLYDFEDNYYEIDFDGKIIYERKAD